MLRWLKRLWISLVSGAPDPEQAPELHDIRPLVRYETKLFNNRSAAEQAAQESQVLAVVQSGGKEKWALLRCPCGCSGDLALNLMRSHRPVWELSLDSAGRASLRPSVHATTCGAHFWLRNGMIIWCE